MGARGHNQRAVLTGRPLETDEFTTCGDALAIHGDERSDRAEVRVSSMWLATCCPDAIMKLRQWTAMLSRPSLAVATTIGLVACGSREPTTDAERLARGRELVQQMSARLGAATGVTATTTEVRDVVSSSGAKTSVSMTGEYVLRRPDRFYVKSTGGRGIEAWYNGKMVTVASHQEKVFAQAPMPETVDRTLDALAERYDLPLPLGDLFYSSPEKALLSATTTGGYAGTENVDGTPCHHLKFQDLGVRWELWLPVRGEPLPKRFKTTQEKRKGAPVTDVTFTAWNIAASTDAARFTPNVPKDYEGIAILQRAAAVKSAAATPSPDPGLPVKK